MRVGELRVGELAAALVELVLPADCAGCGGWPAPWCPECASALGPPTAPQLPGGPAVVAVGRYRGPLRTALLRYKERGRRDLAGPLAGLLAARLGDLVDAPEAPCAGPPGPRPSRLARPGSAPPGPSRDGAAAPGSVWPDPVAPGSVGPGPVVPGSVGPGPVVPGSVGPGPVPPGPVQPGPVPPCRTGIGGVGPRCWLVPVPSRPAAARARGGDHVLRLCRRLADGRPGWAVEPALRLTGRVRDSVGLTPAERAANLAGRLSVHPSRLPPSGASVVLVDDVVTTGATLRASRNALVRAGFRVLGALVLCDATTPARRPVG